MECSVVEKRRGPAPWTMASKLDVFFLSHLRLFPFTAGYRGLGLTVLSHAFRAIESVSEQRRQLRRMRQMQVKGHEDVGGAGIGSGVVSSASAQGSCAE